MSGLCQRAADIGILEAAGWVFEAVLGASLRVLRLPVRGRTITHPSTTVEPKQVHRAG